jgi:urease alpha subunit
MIAHLFESAQSKGMGLRMRAWMLATMVGHQIGASPDGHDWLRIARLDRSLAAMTVNSAIHSALPSVVGKVGKEINARSERRRL